MENKTENKSETCEKLAWCKHHHVIAPLVIIFLFIGVFGVGLAIGSEFGHEGDRGEGGRWGNGGCMGGNYFQSERGGNESNDPADVRENELRNYIPRKNNKEQSEAGNKAEAEDSTSTSQSLNATSTIVH